MTELIKLLVLPPNGPLLLAILGCILLRLSPRWGVRLLVTATIAGYLLSLPTTAYWFNRPFQQPPPTEAELAAFDAGAIVVLAGGLSGDSPEYGSDTLGLRTLGRIRYGAYLARRLDLPVLVSGGGRIEPDRPTEGALMKAVLEQEFGLRDVMVEDESRNTQANAHRSADLLAERSIGSVILVTNATHMYRARQVFEQAGLEVLSAPTLFFALHWQPLDPQSWLPSTRAIYQIRYACYEWLGQIWYRLKAS